MNRLTARVFTIIAAVLVIVGTAWYLGTRAAHETERSSTLPQPDLIKTGTPERKDFHIVCRWFGGVESKEAVDIVALEDGRVISVEAKDETPVAKGDLLFILGGPSMDSRTASLQKRLASLQDRTALAEDAVVRKKRSLDEKIISRGELDAAKAALTQLQVELEADRQQSEYLQNTTHIRAQINGVFTGRRVSVGQDVEKGALLARVIAPDKIRVMAALFPTGGIQLQGLEAVSRTSDSKLVSGTVTKVLPHRTSEGATVVWIEGDGLDQHLKPGEKVSGEIVLSIHKGALAVPEDAVIRDEEEKAYVFLKESEDYRKQAVQTGVTSEGWVEIISGIEEGDEIVVQGAYELFYRDFSKIYRVAD